MKILFANQDITPYVEETELSKMGIVASQKIQESGCEIRTFMPRWGNINERRGQLHEVIRLSGLNISIKDTDHPLIIKVASIPQAKMQVYFIDNEEFFSRKSQATDDDNKPFADNDERAVFYARGVIETIKKLRWTPDVIVCQGWMAAFLPILIKNAYKDEPTVANAKIVTALYEDAPQTIFANVTKDCLFYCDDNNGDGSEFDDNINTEDIIKIAVDNSDGIIVASSKACAEAVNYAKQSGKKVLDYAGDDFVAAYKDFFETL